MVQKDSEKAFLGSGWKFPVQIDETTGRMQMSDYEEDIQEAIGIILRTRKGERVMQPEFGCDICDYVFASVNYTTICAMEKAVLEAIKIWEPRVIEVAVKIHLEAQESGKLYIAVSYVVRSTNNPYNLVYPYFINEGFV